MGVTKQNNKVQEEHIEKRADEKGGEKEISTLYVPCASVIHL